MNIFKNVYTKVKQIIDEDSRKRYEAGARAGQERLRIAELKAKQSANSVARQEEEARLASKVYTVVSLYPNKAITDLKYFPILREEVERVLGQSVSIHYVNTAIREVVTNRKELARLTNKIAADTNAQNIKDAKTEKLRQEFLGMANALTKC